MPAAVLMSAWDTGSRNANNAKAGQISYFKEAFKILRMLPLKKVLQSY